MSLFKCKGYTPLHWAALCHNTDCVKKLLLARGIDANIEDASGRTPVMLANGDYEILTLLRSFSEFPVHTFSKVILCGNSGAGKHCAKNLVYATVYFCAYFAFTTNIPRSVHISNIPWYIS